MDGGGRYTTDGDQMVLSEVSIDAVACEDPSAMAFDEHVQDIYGEDNQHAKSSSSCSLSPFVGFSCPPCFNRFRRYSLGIFGCAAAVVGAEVIRYGLFSGP